MILRQESMSAGLEEIIAHLGGYGIDAPPMPRINENVVSYQPDLVSDEAGALVAELYAEDYAAFGYTEALPTARAGDVDLEWLNDVRGRNRRYGVIHRAAMEARRHIQALEKELEVGRGQARAAEIHQQAVLSSRSWRVTRPVRWASDQTSRVRSRLRRDP